MVPRVDDSPFYWYDNEKVPLFPDSTVISLSAQGDDREAVMSLLLEENGLVLESIGGLAHHSDWRRANLHPETSLAQARTAVEALREEEALDFVSLGYRMADGMQRIPVNRLVVRFTDEATSQEIDCLNSSVGMTVERLPSEHPGPTYWLTYPRGAEPLSIASYYYLHPLTVWASPDKITVGSPQG